MFQTIFQLFFTFLFVLLSLSAMADSITVYVSKPPKQQESVGRVDLGSTTSSFSVITSDNFENRHTELSQLIEQETGIQILSSGGVGGFSSASIRGASSEQVAVYVDGVPVNQASGGAFDLSLISLDEVESIELYRGSVPMELGNASLGGAINIITKKTVSGFNSNLKATLGSFTTQEYSLSVSGGKDKNSFILSANALKSDNDYEFINNNGTENNPDDDRREKRNNSALRRDSALAKWKYKINSNANIDSKLEWLDRLQQIPGVQNNPDADGVVLLKNLDFFSQYNQKHFYSSQAEFSAKVFAGQLEDRFIDSRGANGFSPSDVQSFTDNIGSEIFVKYKADFYQLKYRLLFERQDFTSEDFENDLSPQSSQRNYFEQVFEYKYFSFHNSLISAFSLRHVYAEDNNNIAWDIFDNPVDVEDREYNILTPQLGIKYKFNSAAYINFNMGEYVRLPSFFELFGDQGFFRGASNLKEETGLNIDVGYVYTIFKLNSWLDNSKFYLGYFHNTIENLIVREVNSQGFSTARNIANAQINGVEANVKLYPQKKWSVLLNATYQDSENTSDIPAYTGKRLPAVYEQDYSLLVSYANQKWISGISWQLKKNMYYDRPNLLPATDISDINLSILRKWQRHSFEFKADNLLNNQYENFRLQPTAGTAYYLTYTYRL